MKLRLMLVALLALTAGVACGGNGPRGNYSRGGYRGAPRAVVVAPVYRIPMQDARFLQGYYRDSYRGRRLPPGIQNRLQRGQGLPRGWRMQPVPRGLQRGLAPLPRGYRRGLVNGAFVVVNPRGVIVDFVAPF